MRSHVAVVSTALALALISGPNVARSQVPCGDLNHDARVDSLDALILREHLVRIQVLDLEQSLGCDVAREMRAPGLEPDPGDLAGACSLADAVVMARNELALAPGPAGVCALASSGDCCAERTSLGCNDRDTVICTCGKDASCCTVGWDGACASLACETACAPSCPAAQAYCTAKPS